MTPTETLLRPIALLVDDEPALLVAASRTLRGSFDVIVASSVDDALEKSQGQTLDLVLTDYAMPGRNGIELLHALCQRYGHMVPALLVTAYAGSDDIDEAVAKGIVSRVVSKPWGPSMLLAEARKAVGLITEEVASKSDPQ